MTPLRRFIERLPDLAMVPDPGYDLFRSACGRVAGRVGRLHMTSRFAPVRTPDGVLRGVHACLEAIDPATGASLPEDALFPSSLTDEELVSLDRRARMVHLLNFFGQLDPGGRPDLRGCVLHLTVHPRLPAAVSSDHGRAFRRVADSLGVPLSRLALVLPPLHLAQEDLLINVMASYRLNGFSTQLCPVSVPQARRLLGRVGPDAMRMSLDSWLGRESTDDPAGHELARQLRALRPGGIPLIATGIDSRAHLLRATAAGAALLEGRAVGSAESALPGPG